MNSARFPGMGGEGSTSSNASRMTAANFLIKTTSPPESPTKLVDATSPTTPGTALSKNTSLSRSLSRKSTIVTEAAKEHKKSYLLAGLSALAFGTANYFMSDLSIRCGPQGMYTECFGLFITWALFHLYNLIKHKFGKDKSKPFFSKSSSPYFEEFLEDDEEPKGDEENQAKQQANEIDLSMISEENENENEEPQVPASGSKINIEPQSSSMSRAPK